MFRAFASNEPWNEIKAKALDNIQLFFYCAINDEALFSLGGCFVVVWTSSFWSQSISLPLLEDVAIESRRTTFNNLATRGPARNAFWLSFGKEFLIDSAKANIYEIEVGAWMSRAQRDLTDGAFREETTMRDSKCFSNDANWYSGCDVSAFPEKTNRFSVNFDSKAFAWIIDWPRCNYFMKSSPIKRN